MFRFKSKWSPRALVILISILAANPRNAGSQENSHVRSPRLNKRVLLNGLNVIIVENHKDPKVALNLMIKEGATYDPATKGGLANFTAEMLKLGTKNRSRQNVAQEINDLGAEMNIRVGWDASYVVASSPAKNFDKLLDVFSDTVMEPAFGVSEFNSLKQQILQTLSAQKDDPKIAADNVFNSILFEGTSYAHPVMGASKSVATITLDDVKDFYRKFYIPNNGVLTIVGDVNVEEATKKASRKFGIWIKGDPTPFTFMPPRSPAGIRAYLIDRPDSEMCEVLLGHLGVTRLDDDYFPFLIMNKIVGGERSSSRLGSRVSLNNNRASVVGSRFDARRLQGPFAVSGIVPENQVLKFITEAFDALKRFKEEGPTEKELSEAKTLIINAYPKQFETSQQIAEKILEVELYQLGTNYINSYQDRIQEITVSQVKKAAERRLNPNNAVVVVVGKAQTVGPQLERTGRLPMRLIADKESY